MSSLLGPDTLRNSEKSTQRGPRLFENRSILLLCSVGYTGLSRLEDVQQCAVQTAMTHDQRIGINPKIAITALVCKALQPNIR